MVKDKIKTQEERQAEVRPIIEKLTEMNITVLEHDLERKIEQLQLKIRTYQELMKDTKALKFKITTLESEIIKKDNLIEGMKKIIDDLSIK